MSPVRNPVAVTSSSETDPSSVENSSSASPPSSEDPSRVSETPVDPGLTLQDIEMEDAGDLEDDVPPEVPPRPENVPPRTTPVKAGKGTVRRNVPPSPADVPPVADNVPPAAAATAAAAGAPAAAAAASAAGTSKKKAGKPAGAAGAPDPAASSRKKKAAPVEPLGIASKTPVPPGASWGGSLAEAHRRLPPAQQEALRQAARPPAYNLPSDEQLGDTRNFGKFLAFFVRVGAELRGKQWLPEVEAWLLRQFKADASLAVAEGLQHKTPSERYNNCIFFDICSCQEWIFSLFFRDERPADVVENFLAKLRVGKNTENSAVARDCTHLAHLVREAYGYYPDSARITMSVVLARIKAILPQFAQALLRNAEVTTEKPISTFEHMLRLLRQCDDSYKAHVQSGQPGRSSLDKSGRNPDGGAGKKPKRKAGKRPENSDRTDEKPSKFVKKDPKSDLFCKYCKKPGHVVNDCRKLAYKKKLEASKGASLATDKKDKLNALLTDLTALLK